MLAASTGATKSGTACCGSPTERLIGGLPGWMPAMRSDRRTKGERESTAGAGVCDGSRWAVMVGMAVHRAGAEGPHTGRSRPHYGRRGYVLFFFWFFCGLCPVTLLHPPIK